MLASVALASLALACAEPSPVAPSVAPTASPIAPATGPTSAGATVTGVGGGGRRTTELMERHRGRIVATASSTWPSWGPERLVDGDPATSWFSQKGDAAANGTKPWVELRFPVDVDVKRVSVLGNREPNWPRGFTIHYGMLELIDANGKVLATIKNEGKNVAADVDFPIKAPISRVRAVRFTSLMDDGDQTQFKDIALAEVLVD